MHKPNYESAYLGAYLNPNTLAKEIRKMVAQIKAGPEFDAIAFSGSSGCLIGAPIAARLKKPMILVRKREVRSHTSMIVEGDKAARTYIIVDDLISMGFTVHRIQDDIKSWSGARCVAIYTKEGGREEDCYIHKDEEEEIVVKDTIAAPAPKEITLYEYTLLDIPF